MDCVLAEVRIGLASLKLGVGEGLTCWIILIALNIYFLLSSIYIIAWLKSGFVLKPGGIWFGP